MADQPASISIQDRYASQFAADLEKNLAEQEELQQRLERLKSEETWLRAVQVSLPAAESGFVDTAPTAAEEAPVPQPRQEASAKRTARARKTAPTKATDTGPAMKTVNKAAAEKKNTTRGEAPLGDLLLLILDKASGEPRTAAELTTVLEQEVPMRARGINTVRNTLERLVAKSRVERTKQGSTVYYTMLQRPSGAVAMEADTAPLSAESAGTPAGEESEKAAAQV